MCKPRGVALGYGKVGYISFGTGCDKPRKLLGLKCVGHHSFGIGCSRVVKFLMPMYIGNYVASFQYSCIDTSFNYFIYYEMNYEDKVNVWWMVCNGICYDVELYGMVREIVSSGKEIPMLRLLGCEMFEDLINKEVS